MWALSPPDADIQLTSVCLDNIIIQVRTDLRSSLANHTPKTGGVPGGFPESFHKYPAFG